MRSVEDTPPPVDNHASILVRCTPDVPKSADRVTSGHLKMAGRLCVYGVLSENKFTFDKSAAPYNFSVLMHQWPTREKEARAHEPLCNWVKEGVLVPDDFITHSFDINDVEKAFEEENVMTGVPEDRRHILEARRGPATRYSSRVFCTYIIRSPWGNYECDSHRCPLSSPSPRIIRFGSPYTT